MCLATQAECLDFHPLNSALTMFDSYRRYGFEMLQCEIACLGCYLFETKQFKRRWGIADAFLR